MADRFTTTVEERGRRAASRRRGRYHQSIDASNLEVSVSAGEVTLLGTVDSRCNKRLAEDFARLVAGVRDIHTHLRSGEPGG